MANRLVYRYPNSKREFSYRGYSFYTNDYGYFVAYSYVLETKVFDDINRLKKYIDSITTTTKK